MACQSLSAALVRSVHVTPSGEVMTRLPVPVIDTAQNRPSSGDQHMDRQSLSAGVTCAVQVMPSGEVITLLPVPVIETAANKPSCGDHAIPHH